MLDFGGEMTLSERASSPGKRVSFTEDTDKSMKIQRLQNDLQQKVSETPPRVMNLTTRSCECDSYEF